MAIKIQKVFRALPTEIITNFMKSVLVIQMLWRGNNTRGSVQKAVERERLHFVKHVEDVQRMKRITKELHQHLFVEQAKRKVQATRVIEKYFVYWLFLKRRLHSTVVIQKWWRGYVARHIYAVFRVSIQRMMA